eukprot:6154284-Pleurochrysis_carterae.AAC.2
MPRKMRIEPPFRPLTAILGGLFVRKCVFIVVHKRERARSHYAHARRDIGVATYARAPFFPSRCRCHRCTRCALRLVHANVLP